MLPFCFGVALLATALFAGPAGGAAPKGGTLRVDLRYDFDFVDPALADSPQTRSVEHLTCTTLFDVSGARLAPDAAVSAPVVSADGRSYTIRLKSGLQYDTGDGITARDFAAAIGRVADPKLSSPGSAYTAAIASVRASSTYTLRIRLKRPAPDFASRLSSPFFCPLPPGTPHDPRGIVAPVPGSGPYYIASWEKDRSLVLKRNRFYQGGKAANPDEIDLNVGISYALQQLRCEQDEADICGFPPGNAAALRKQYGVNRGRFFVKRHRTLYFLSINREQDLFRDNNQLARAVNLALDRPAILRLNGSLGGTATDQLLPRGIRGFHDWRLYPLNRANVRKARQLARGHLRDRKCQLWSFNDGLGPGAAQTIQLELEKIGLDCDVTLLDRSDLYRQAGARGAGYDLLLNSWDAQYPDPFDYLRLFDGREIRARNNENLSYFEVARVDRLLAAAAEKAGRARSRAYASLDRELMSRYAPAAPLFVSDNTRVLVSSRVGCYTSNEVYGVDYGALCLNQQSAKLAVAVAGPGTVASDPPGISCATSCSHDFTYGGLVILTARPAPGSDFVAWTGDCSGSNARCTVTMNGARDVHAVFRKKS